LLATKNFGTWLSDIQKIEPTITNQRDWFSEFYEAVREEAAALAEGTRTATGEQSANAS
jgi:hypothetical protein